MRYFSLFIIITCSISYAQVDTLWTKKFGENNQYAEGYCVQQTADDGYIITGKIYSYLAKYGEIWLIKTDLSGNTIWTKKFGECIVNFGENAVQQTADGGYIIIGSKKGVDPDYSNIWLIKTDASGDTLWTKTFGRNDADFGSSVQQTPDGGYILTGTSYNQDLFQSIMLLIKTDASGDTLWTKIIDRVFDLSWPCPIQLTSDEGYIISGTKWADEIGQVIWLIKTNSTGDTLWTKTYNGFNELGSEQYSFDVQQTTDEGYIILAEGFTPVSRPCIWLVKTDSSGDTLWTKTLNTGNDTDFGESIQQTTDGGYIIAGNSQLLNDYKNYVSLIKTSSSGEVFWTKTFGSGQSEVGASSGQQTGDGGYVIVGTSRSTNRYDIWLIKTTHLPSFIEKNNIDGHLNFTLSQCYPNPFNPSTTIEFSIPSFGFVSLKIFNIMGQEIATLVNQELVPGIHKIEWNPGNLSSGLYLYKLETGGYKDTKKLIYLK